MSAGTTATDVLQVRRASLRGWWLLPLVQLLLVFALGLPASSAGWLLQGIHLLTACLCAFALSRDNRPFSLNQVYWVFTFVFLALMPALFFSLDFLPHGKVPEAVLKKASLLVWICALLYTLVRFLLQRLWPAQSHADKNISDAEDFKPQLSRIPIVMGLCVLTVAIVIGPANLWLQTDYWQALSARLPNTLLQLLFQYGLRGIMLYCCLLSVYAFRRGWMHWQILLTVLLLALIANFPLAMSRYLAGTFYLSILLWWLPAGWLKPPRFALLLMTAILLAAPVLNITRLQHFPIETGKQRDLSFLLQTSYSGDYDAYAMLCRTIQYTDSLGSSRGRQLTGALLFFVPRNHWSGKPVGSGSMVYQVMVPRADHWDNVSCPLTAEGYVNFSFAGSLLFTLLLAIVIFFYDRHFRQWRYQNKPGYAIVFYPVAIGLLLLWLRGDMMSAVAYSTGLFVSGWAAQQFFFRHC